MSSKSEYNERKQRVIDLLNLAKEFYKSVSDSATADDNEKFESQKKVSSIEELITETENNTFSIVVVGQFSAGKSTFLNALMNEKYLPSFQTETTATINFLKSVKESPTGKELIKVNYVDGNEELCNDVTLENIQKFVTTKGDNVAQKVKSVELYLDSKYLNDGVSLVDSPGLNGILEGHGDITNRQIDTSHAAIFLFNAHQPGSKSDFEILKNLTDRCKNVFIVLNQIDLINKSEQSVDDVIQSVRDSYANQFHSNDVPEIYPVSAYKALVGRSKKNLDYREKNKFTDAEKEDFIDSSMIENFEERLMRFLTKGEKAKSELLAPIERIDSFLDTTKSEMEEKIAGLETSLDLNDVKEEIANLQAEIDGLKTRLSESTSNISKRVAYILKEAEDEIKSLTQQAKEKAETKIASQEDLEDLEANGELYLKNIFTTFSNVVNDACRRADEKYKDMIRDEFAEYANAIEERLGDTTVDTSNKLSIDRSIFETDVDLDSYIEERNELKKKISDIQNKVDESEIDLIRAHAQEEERIRAEQRLDRLQNKADNLGPRPEVSRYTTLENSRGWFGTFFLGAKYDRQVVRFDDSAVKAYENEKARLNEVYEQKYSKLEAELRRIPKSNTAEIEYTQKKLKREQDSMSRRLQELEEEREQTFKKVQRKNFNKARTYLTDYCDKIERESLSKVYDGFKSRKEDMVKTALDVIGMGINDALAKKMEVMHFKENHLNSSVEERDKVIADRKQLIERLTILKKELDDLQDSLNSIQVDVIKRG